MTQAEERKKEEMMAGAPGTMEWSKTGWVGDWRYYTVQRVCLNCGTRGCSAETWGREKRPWIQCPNCGVVDWRV